jgi:mannose-6-phosphate isomerase-like protein (cupin superfamily)
MKRASTIFFSFFIIGASWNTSVSAQHSEREMIEKSKNGYVIELENELAKEQTGPHHGGGTTTGYSFFSSVAGMDYVFRKRALHPGSAIGYHEQKKDEIYYVLRGRGELTMNGKKSIVGPGTAILTRSGSAHGLRQLGDEDLVIFIIYGK